MKLYIHPLSGHSHRVVLFLSLAGIPVETEVVDLLQGEQKRPEFLARNAFGQVPVLVDDDGTIVADSNAILVYLAVKHGLTNWHPTDAQGAAEVQRWLSVSAGQLAHGPAAARLVTLFGARLDAEAAVQRAYALFSVVEKVLGERPWLASKEQPTLADVAFYSYAFSAPEGNVSLAAYPRLRAFLQRIEELPGFVPFQASEVGLRASA